MPVILGCDFISKHTLVVNIQGGTVHQLDSEHSMNLDTQVAKLCSPLIIDDKLPQALSSKSTGPSISDLPQITIEEYKLLFSQQIGRTNITHHIIDIGNASPVALPYHFPLCKLGPEAAHSQCTRINNQTQ